MTLISFGSSNRAAACLHWMHCASAAFLGSEQAPFAGLHTLHTVNFFPKSTVSDVSFLQFTVSDVFSPQSHCFCQWVWCWLHCCHSGHSVHMTKLKTKRVLGGRLNLPAPPRSMSGAVHSLPPPSREVSVDCECRKMRIAWTGPTLAEGGGRNGPSEGDRNDQVPLQAQH